MIWALPRAQGPGPTSGAPTCSTAARRSTTPTPAPTAGTSPSARSSRSSTPQLLDGLGPRPDADLPAQHDRRRAGRSCGSGSPRRSRTRTRDEWAAVFEGTDACVDAGARAAARSPTHPHLAARGTIVAPGRRRRRPRPAPRFSPHARDAARSRRRSRRTSRRCSRTGRADPANDGTRHPGRGDGVQRVLRQADGVSSTSRLRVRFGSTGMPGPVVVATMTFFRYRPLAADGLARRTSSSAAP